MLALRTALSLAYEHVAAPYLEEDDESDGEDPDPATAAAELNAWFKRCGGSGAAEVRASADNRCGLFATAPLGAGDAYVRVPRRLLLDRASSLASAALARARGARGGRRLRRGGHRCADGVRAAGAGTGRRRRLAPCSVRAGAAEALRGAPAPRRVGRRVPRGHLRARRAPRRAARRGPVRGSGARVLRRRRAAEPVAVGLPVLDDALHLRAGPRARRRAGLGVRARGGHDELPLGARSAAVEGGV